MLHSQALQQFEHLHDFHALTEAVLRVCQTFGPVRSYECVRLVQDKNSQVALCFVELDSESHQMDLIRSLGACTFGEGVCLKIPMQGTFQAVMDSYCGPRKQQPELAALLR